VNFHRLIIGNRSSNLIRLDQPILLTLESLGKQFTQMLQRQGSLVIPRSMQIILTPSSFGR
jgi:hypothetical protein